MHLTHVPGAKSSTELASTPNDWLNFHLSVPDSSVPPELRVFLRRLRAEDLMDEDVGDSVSPPYAPPLSTPLLGEACSGEPHHLLGERKPVGLRSDGGDARGLHDWLGGVMERLFEDGEVSSSLSRLNDGTGEGRSASPLRRVVDGDKHGGRSGGDMGS